MVRKYGNDSKYKSGTALKYINRTLALKKLQVSLSEFRRICILKGIYPREPTKKKQAGKGSTAPTTYYLRRDIQRILKDPIIEYVREDKIHKCRLLKSEAKGDINRVEELLENPPTYSLDATILERYPTFVDALNDLDDCLNIVFMYAVFPQNENIPGHLVTKCKQLSDDFRNFVSAKRALRKIFVSIKGIYYEAEIEGVKIHWITPHVFAYKEPEDVDFKIMGTFAEFYCALLEFVNFRLFQSLGVCYPLKSDEVLTVVDDDEPKIDLFEDSEADETVRKFREQYLKTERQKSLFKGLKFFLGREVPKDFMALVIRSGSGNVSWDRYSAEGATFGQSDESITHEIADRPNVVKNYINRAYVQPQWVLDSFNECRLLPVEDYFVGVKLPPHLSPFVVPKEGDYVPPERVRLDLNLPPNHPLPEDFISDSEEETEENKSKNVVERCDDLEKSVKRKRPSIIDEEKRKLSEMLIPRRKRFVYNRAKEAEEKRRENTQTLRKRRRLIDNQDKVDSVNE